MLFVSCFDHNDSGLFERLFSDNALMKDVMWCHLLNNGIYSLARCDALNVSEKYDFVERLYESIQNESKKIKKNTIQKAMQLIEPIVKLEDPKKLNEIKNLEGMQRLVESMFVNVFTIDDIDDLSDKYINSFMKFRNPHAIYTYFDSLNQLPDQERESALNAYNTYIREVLEGTFHENRYDLDRNIHLKAIFDQIGENLLAKWKEGRILHEKDMNLSLQNNEQNETSYYDQFKEKIFDGHLGENWKQKFPNIYSVFSDKVEVNAVMGHLSNSEDKTHQLEWHILNLCQYDTYASINVLKQSLRTIKRLSKGLELENDVKAWLQNLGNKKEPKAYSIVDTDDPEDLLVCGTEIEGSCQRINGSARLNKGLLGYLLNGQTRLIAVKNEKGVIVGRCLLRLLISEETNQPVLYRERIYINGKNEKVKMLLRTMTEIRARELDLSMYSSDHSPMESLISLGGPAPFEYVDAARGIQENSSYRI